MSTPSYLIVGRLINKEAVGGWGIRGSGGGWGGGGGISDLLG